ncbi:hypothetical protein [Leptospira weilii]|uniref:Uncharacterized protein n=1 Tax=Leptospira weilii str. UI 13098 TaxID=1088542 RepID=M6QIF1_9LEPT|nr:hypothetical protein LEP1GSC108_2784 [Leptospira weilii str. UI 13098]
MKEIPEHFPIRLLDRKEAMTGNTLGISSTNYFAGWTSYLSSALPLWGQLVLRTFLIDM